MSKVYQIVTDRILEEMENTGLPPWQKAWSGIDSLPTSNSTGKPYRGSNLFLLSMMQKEQPLFFTYNQLVKIGEKELSDKKALVGEALKGKFLPVTFWKRSVKKDKKTGKESVYMILRYFNVINAEDVPKLPAKYLQKLIEFAHNPDANAEQVLATIKDQPSITHGGTSAHYTPSDHTVTMPRKESFKDSNTYYSVLFHELIHWTSKELGRDMGSRFGQDDYATEELIAEFGAAMLCGLCGIDNTLENSAAYIKSWSKRFKDDPKLIVQAAGKAQKAVDLIMGTVFEKQAEN